MTSSEKEGVVNTSIRTFCKTFESLFPIMTDGTLQITLKNVETWINQEDTQSWIELMTQLPCPCVHFNLNKESENGLLVLQIFSMSFVAYTKLCTQIGHVWNKSSCWPVKHIHIVH